MNYSLIRLTSQSNSGSVLIFYGSIEECREMKEKLEKYSKANYKILTQEGEEIE